MIGIRSDPKRRRRASRASTLEHRGTMSNFCLLPVSIQSQMLDLSTSTTDRLRCWPPCTCPPTGILRRGYRWPEYLRVTIFLFRWRTNRFSEINGRPSAYTTVTDHPVIYNISAVRPYLWVILQRMGVHGWVLFNHFPIWIASTSRLCLSFSILYAEIGFPSGDGHCFGSFHVSFMYTRNSQNC